MPSKELIASVIEAIVKNPPTVTRFKDMETLEYSEAIDYTPTAQAAISTILASLQEPNAEMLKALWSANASRGWPEAAKTCWQAVLTASALGEQSDG